MCVCVCVYSVSLYAKLPDERRLLNFISMTTKPYYDYKYALRICHQEGMYVHIVYVHVCASACIYVCVHVCVCMSMYMCVYMCVSACLCICVCTCVCLHVYVYVCVHVCACMSMYMCVSVCVWCVYG